MTGRALHAAAPGGAIALAIVTVVAALCPRSALAGEGGVAPLASDLAIIGELFGAPVRRGDFAAELALLRQQVRPGFSPEELWSRLAMLAEAERRGLRVSPEARGRRCREIVRAELIEERARVGLEGSLETPENRASLAARRAQLEVSFEVGERDYRGFFERRSADRVTFERLVRTALMLRAVRASARGSFELEDRWRSERRAATARVELGIVELPASRFVLPLPEPPEAALRLRYEEDRLRFRRPALFRYDYAVTEGEQGRAALAALETGAEALAALDEALVVARGRVELAPLASLPAALARGRAEIEAWFARARPRTQSPLFELGGRAARLWLAARRPAGTPPFSEARARVRADLLQRASLAHLASRAWALARLLDDVLDPAAVEAVLTRRGFVERRLEPFELGRAPAVRGVAAPLLERSGRTEPGRRRVVLDIEGRRALVVRCLRRAPGSLGPAGRPAEADLERLEGRAFQQWRRLLRLRAKGATPAHLSESRRVLGRAGIRLTRVLSFGVGALHSGVVTARFRLGESLKALATELGVRGVRTLELARPRRLPLALARAASGVFTVEPDGARELFFCEPAGRDAATIWQRVYRVSLDRPLTSAERAELVGELEPRDHAAARRRFRALAAARSSAPSRGLAGYVGLLGRPRDKLLDALEELLVEVPVGARSSFVIEGRTVLVEVLDARPRTEREALAHPARFDAGLSWSDSEARRRLSVGEPR